VTTATEPRTTPSTSWSTSADRFADLTSSCNRPNVRRGQSTPPGEAVPAGAIVGTAAGGRLGPEGVGGDDAFMLAPDHSGHHDARALPSEAAYRVCTYVHCEVLHRPPGGNGQISGAFGCTMRVPPGQRRSSARSGGDCPEGRRSTPHPQGRTRVDRPGSAESLRPPTFASPLSHAPGPCRARTDHDAGSPDAWRTPGPAWGPGVLRAPPHPRRSGVTRGGGGGASRVSTPRPVTTSARATTCPLARAMLVSSMQ
jgi:hypothetical protein